MWIKIESNTLMALVWLVDPMYSRSNGSHKYLITKLSLYKWPIARRKRVFTINSKLIPLNMYYDQCNEHLLSMMMCVPCACVFACIRICDGMALRFNECPQLENARK